MARCGLLVRGAPNPPALAQQQPISAGGPASKWGSPSAQVREHGVARLGKGGTQLSAAQRSSCHACMQMQMQMQ